MTPQEEAELQCKIEKEIKELKEVMMPEEWHLIPFIILRKLVKEG